MFQSNGRKCEVEGEQNGNNNAAPGAAEHWKNASMLCPKLGEMPEWLKGFGEIVE